MREVTDDDKSLAYSEAVNGQCPDGIHKDECWKCMQAVMARAIAAAREEGRAAGYGEGIRDASKVAHRIAYEYQRFGDNDFARVAAQLRDAILTPGDPALAPAATTTKEPK